MQRGKPFHNADPARSRMMFYVTPHLISEGSLRDTSWSEIAARSIMQACYHLAPSELSCRADDAISHQGAYIKQIGEASVFGAAVPGVPVTDTVSHTVNARTSRARAPCRL